MPRTIDQTICAHWMPVSQEPCARTLGHKGRHKTATALNNHREAERSRRASDPEKYRVYDRERYANSEERREQNRASFRRRYAVNPEKDREKKRRFYEAYPEYQSDYREALRQEVFDHYGWECACCGSDDNLSLDHINGDGAVFRKSVFGTQKPGSSAVYLWVIRNDFPGDLQTMCMPCNLSKGRGEACMLNHELDEAA